METIFNVLKFFIAVVQFLTICFVIILFTTVEAVPGVGVAIIIGALYLCPVRTILVVIFTIPLMQEPGMTFSDWFIPWFIFWVLLVGTSRLLVPMRAERA